MKIRTLIIAAALATAPALAACGEETAESETSVAAAEESTGTEDTEGLDETLDDSADETSGDELADEAAPAEDEATE